MFSVPPLWSPSVPLHDPQQQYPHSSARANYSYPSMRLDHHHHHHRQNDLFSAPLVSADTGVPPLSSHFSYPHSYSLVESNNIHHSGNESLLFQSPMDFLRQQQDPFFEAEDNGNGGGVGGPPPYPDGLSAFASPSNSAWGPPSSSRPPYPLHDPRLYPQAVEGPVDALSRLNPQQASHHSYHQSVVEDIPEATFAQSPFAALSHSAKSHRYTATPRPSPHLRPRTNNTHSASGVTPSPWMTAHSASPDVAPHVVFSVIDHPKANEVGLALINLQAFTVTLLQFGDTASLSKTLQQIELYQPVDLLFPHTSANSKLVTTLLRQYGAPEEDSSSFFASPTQQQQHRLSHNGGGSSSSSRSLIVNFVAVHRRLYNESKGAGWLLQLMSSASTDSINEVQNTDRYLCVAAANALLHYVESMFGIALLPKTVRVRYCGLQNYAEVDRLTAKCLRLVHTSSQRKRSRCDDAATAAVAAAPRSADRTAGGGKRAVSAPSTTRRGSVTPSGAAGKGVASLIDAIDYTSTGPGRRLLRLNVLQPLRDVTSITKRQDCVQFLVTQAPQLFPVLRAYLRRCANDDLEHIIGSLCWRQGTTSVASAIDGGRHRVVQTAAMEAVLEHLTALAFLLSVSIAIREALLPLMVVASAESTDNEKRQSENIKRRSALQALEHHDDGWMEGPTNPTAPSTSVDAVTHSGDAAAAATATDSSEAARHLPHLLQSIGETLVQCDLESLRSMIMDKLDEEVVAASVAPTAGGRGGPQLGAGRKKLKGASLQVQHCFALKPDASSALHVARRKFTDALETIFATCETLKQTYRIPSLRVGFDSQREYHLVYEAAHDALAPENVFLRKYRPSTQSKHVICTSREILVLRAAVADALTEVAVEQDSVLSEVYEGVRRHLGSLQAVCDALGLLDLLVAFASFAKLRNAVRPLVGAGNPFVVPNVSHLVDLRHLGPSFGPAPRAAMVPGDLSLSSEQPVVLLTGPNNAGKSTILTLLGQITILAHIGAFIPVAALHRSPPHVHPPVSIRLVDRIVAVMPATAEEFNMLDSLHLSSFALEMRMLSFLLSVATKDSLVLIDELGRGTIGDAGCALLQATLEWLAASNVASMTATHFTQLVALAETIPQLQNQQMVVSTQPVRSVHPTTASNNNNNNNDTESDKPRKSIVFQYQYRVARDGCTEQNYGLSVARSLGVSPSIIEFAETVVYPAVVAMHRATMQDPVTAWLERCRSLLHQVASNHCRNKTTRKGLPSLIVRACRAVIQAVEQQQWNEAVQAVLFLNEALTSSVATPIDSTAQSTRTEGQSNAPPLRHQQQQQQCQPRQGHPPNATMLPPPPPPPAAASPMRPPTVQVADHHPIPLKNIPLNEKISASRKHTTTTVGPPTATSSPQDEEGTPLPLAQCTPTVAVSSSSTSAHAAAQRKQRVREIFSGGFYYSR